MYRPEGWQENRKKAFAVENSWIVEDTGFAYEAGADAMLEGLKKKGLKVNNLGDIPQGKGTIIFIPKEK